LNYLPLTGYWFYGAASDVERAAFYCSWGLLAVAPLFAASKAFPFLNIFRRRRR